MLSNDNLETTKSVVTDYFIWRLKSKRVTNNRLFDIVHAAGYDTERKYSSSLSFSNCHSSSSMINAEAIHRAIGNELFSDGKISWARIITFISFSALLAENILKETREEEKDTIISSTIDWTTNFIDQNFQTWLESERYWAGCLNMYKIPERQNSLYAYGNFLRAIGAITLGLMYMIST
ncbi:unnamed protein product [Rotaria socialis]|uniref:Bcl-2 Bcl-2 homology region 1-3 domain-containing protein n=1 Tax=Rotaria socialis TaxID=392032 RepID=A0A820PDV7_9BILA|nr:unnamed protein product [Rotaria socialis]CAF3517038.1 unnamed protein product [Rotaria socialis]CAF3725406.1 unnamed protein product [Rotaria socialis]CAF4401405.1 unnamed protein product [Rotaria socialis]CAF4431052.1 unnamed protein product [Rotaria socialis]